MAQLYSCFFALDMKKWWIGCSGFYPKVFLNYFNNDIRDEAIMNAREFEDLVAR
jgi:hypothetical protein